MGGGKGEWAGAGGGVRRAWLSRPRGSEELDAFDGKER